MNSEYQPSPQQIVQKELLFRLLDLSEKNKIKVFVMGGYGLDALYGKLTRDHRDFDIYIYKQDETKFKQLLADLNFSSTNRLVGEIKKREYMNPEYTDKFSIEYGIIEEGMRLMSTQSIEDYIPSSPIGVLEGEPVPTFTLKAFKETIEFNNQPAAKHTEPYRHQQWLDELMPKLEAKYN